ncbi:MAG: histidine phosphatase family protein [Candidatus Aenigmatarchaeota archaeon]
MRLILIRHAESNANVKKVLGNHRSRLSKKGIIQARKLGMRLKNEKIDAVFSSRYKRAAETARLLCELHKPKINHITFVAEAKERNYGKFEGKPHKHFIEEREKSGKHWHLFRPDGGENYSDITKRAKKFYAMLRKTYAGKTVVIVSHDVFNRVLISHILKKPLSHAAGLWQGNACMNVIDVRNDADRKAKLIAINDTKHLC